MQSRWAATERRGGSDSEDSDSEVLGGSPDLENPSSVDAAPDFSDFSEPHFEPSEKLGRRASDSSAPSRSSQSS